MGFKLSKFGYTSWGMPFRMAFGAGMFIADKRGIAKMGITFEGDKIVEHLLDDKFRLTPLQHREVMDMATEFYTQYRKTVERAKDIITPLAIASLRDYNVSMDDIPRFVTSKTYRKLIQRLIQLIRESMYLDNPDDDWIFSSIGDGERSGPIYRAVDERLAEILISLARSDDE